MAHLTRVARSRFHGKGLHAESAWPAAPSNRRPSHLIQEFIHRGYSRRRCALNVRDLRKRLRTFEEILGIFQGAHFSKTVRTFERSAHLRRRGAAGEPHARLPASRRFLRWFSLLSRFSISCDTKRQRRSADFADDADFPRSSLEPFRSKRSTFENFKESASSADNLLFPAISAIRTTTARKTKKPCRDLRSGHGSAICEIYSSWLYRIFSSLA